MPAAMRYILTTMALGLLIGGGLIFRYGDNGPAPIRVGVLHSLSGTMAISERHVKNATLLAIEQINRKGGIDGRRIDPVIADGHSNRPTFASEAERLLEVEKVSAIFGCWTSAGRKTIKPIIEKHHNLLLYPVQYEGMERSSNIIYGGEAPNQQIIPAMQWCFKNMGPRFFLVGSDYIFPRAANEIIKSEAARLGAMIVGEHYLLLGETRVRDVIEKIMKSEPDIIFNTINGGTNREFFREMSYAGMTADRFPVMSFSVAEKEIEVIGASIVEGHFSSFSYFQSLDTVENRQFVQAIKAKYGVYSTVSAPMASAYANVHEWAWAVKAAGSDDPEKVMRHLKGQRFKTPAGPVTIDPDNNHSWRMARIGRVKENGQFEIVWQSPDVIPPDPYPAYKTHTQWESFLSAWFNSWQGEWGNHAP